MTHTAPERSRTVSAAEVATTRRGTVVVTDLEGRGSLAAARSLSRTGYRVVGASTSRLAPGRWSRTCDRRILLPDPRPDPARYARELAAALADEAADLVVVGSDATLLAVSAGREVLEPVVRTELPAHEVVLRVTDKVAVAAAAAAVGLTGPAGVECADAGAVRAAVAARGYPLLLKPPRSVALEGGTLRERRSRRVGSPAELERALAELGLPLLVQELVEGPVYSVAGVAADGALRGCVVARYLRTWPADAGAAAFAETVVPDSGVVERVEELVVSLGWSGIFEVELVRRPDGTYAVIDLNPRVYGSLALSGAAGAPLAVIWCDTALGHGDDFREAAPGIGYRCEDFDARHLFVDLWRRHPADALAVLRPRRHVTHAYSDLRDPLPVAVRWIGGAARRVRHR